MSLIANFIYGHINDAWACAFYYTTVIIFHFAYLTAYNILYVFCKSMRGMLKATLRVRCLIITNMIKCWKQLIKFLRIFLVVWLMLDYHQLNLLAKFQRLIMYVTTTGNSFYFCARKPNVTKYLMTGWRRIKYLNNWCYNSMSEIFLCVLFLFLKMNPHGDTFLVT